MRNKVLSSEFSLSLLATFYLTTDYGINKCQHSDEIEQTDRVSGDGGRGQKLAQCDDAVVRVDVELVLVVAVDDGVSQHVLHAKHKLYTLVSVSKK